MQGLPPLAPGQVYQLWLLRAGRIESVQVFRLSGGAGTITVPIAPTSFTALYITIEPAPGGSAAPSGPAILTGNLGAADAVPVPTLACPPPGCGATATASMVATALAPVTTATPTV